jgi:Leucine-rich repeat (LRR) protein
VGEVTNEICDLRDKNLHFLWVDCSTMPGTGLPKVPCPADCCTICFEGYDHDGGVSTGGSSPNSQVDTPHIVISDWGADVKKKLSSLSGDGGMALMDINSPQFHAYGWLVEDSDGKGYSDERLYQRYVLANLYFATSGVQWTNNIGWVTSADECDWFGISGCDDSSVETVVSIELPGNNLRGSLPSELFEHFTYLLVLNLSDNHLSGSIPSTVGSMASLSVLELAENELTSHIPSEIGKLTKLDHIFLQKNNLEGQMPNEVCSLRTDHSYGLTLLWADCNGFPPRVQCKKTCCTTCFTNPRNSDETDEVKAPTTHADPDRDIFSTLKKMAPDAGASLDDTLSPQYKAYNWLAGFDNASLTDIILLQRYALATLYFSTAGSGWIEDYFWLSDKSECPNGKENWLGVSKCDGGGMVTHLELSSNRLVGTLPLELSHLRMLQVLDLSNNGLYGTLPKQIGLFQELEVLNIGGNLLSGSIPANLGFVFTLQEVYFHKNSFTGSVPDAICDLKDPLGGIEVLWADCGGDPPLVSCREYCCNECFTNTSDYVAESTVETFNYPTFMPTPFLETHSPSITENLELKSFLIEHMDGFEDSLSDVNLPAYRAYLSIANAENYNNLDPFNMLQR